MIFVTVGTTYAFDSLVKKIDELAPLLKAEIIIQTGRSEYVPKNCNHFRFKPNLAPYLKRASVVVSHGGAGTSFEILKLSKKLVSVENPEVNDKHQSDLLSELERLEHIVWCKDIQNIVNDINEAKKRKLKRYRSPRCDIHKEIHKFLDALK